MIYEICVLAKNEISDDQASKLQEMIRSIVSDFKGEVLIEDNWGKFQLAQQTPEGLKSGHYLYFIYNGEDGVNNEITRRLKIDDNIVKHLMIKLGTEADKQNIVKNYKSPFSKKYTGSVTDGDEEQGSMEKDRKKFARRKSCWFNAKNIKADWKDPATYNWLINEFGKISPARVSGVSCKHQRFATTAIKRARNIGVSSHLSSRIAHRA